jgi:mannose-6-phosphate isomerase-like protein (cupin superfamily)
MGFRTTSLGELERIRLEQGVWRPIRRPLGVTGFGVNAYTGDAAGDAVIEPHDETSPGAGRHEELYVVVSGRAAFEVDGREVDAPSGTMLLVDVGTQRAAVAAEADTTVLVISGKPGGALPVSPFEYWYAAVPAYEAGDYDRAHEIAAEGLDDWPEHGTLHYQLACYRALAGRGDEAIEHLRIAFEQDPRTREWAADDSDLDSIRGDARYPG